MDGFCDCYRIGIIGNKGANPGADFEAWLEDKGTTATRFGTMVNHVLTAQELDAFDILIIDRLTHTYSPQEAAILQTWVEAGHGVISMAGYANSHRPAAKLSQRDGSATARSLDRSKSGKPPHRRRDDRADLRWLAVNGRVKCSCAQGEPNNSPAPRPWLAWAQASWSPTVDQFRLGGR
jgi:hypothetical protein